jgi:hypothetical protein
MSSPTTSAITGAPGTAKTALTQSQRDELIAEILGDVLLLSDKVSEIASQMAALSQAMVASDFVRWRNTLDAKMSELAEVNISEQAAKRLQGVAQAYIEQLSRETNQLVVIETKKAVSNTLAFNQLFDRLHREWLLRLASVAIAAFLGSLLAHWLA